MNRSYLLAAASAAALLASAGAASAQTTRLYNVPAGGVSNPGYSANVYQPSETGSDWNANDSLDMRGDFRLAVGAIADHEYRGIIPSYNPDGTVAASTLRNQVLIHPGLSMIFGDHIRLSGSVPIAVYQDGYVAPFLGNQYYRPPQNDSSVGDIRVGLDFKLAGEYGQGFTLAVGAQGYAPVGQRNNYTGDGVWRVAPHINIAGDAHGFAYAASIAYEYNEYTANYGSIRVGSDLKAQAAVGVHLFNKHLLLGPEAFAYTMTTSSFFDERATPVEIMASANINIADWVHLKGGWGTFLNKGYGAPVSLGTFGIEFVPGVDQDSDHDGIMDSKDACPKIPGIATDDPKTNGCPPPPPADRDGDGVADNEDACPDVAGVRTSDPKTNGCPADADGDGIPDNVDACPSVPGIKTDDPKTNGCPGDRDGDGITDDKDACPDQPGIHTDDPKTNGCPDPDRDHDGVLNDVDACPDQAGPKTEDPKTNGCPRVFIKGGNIQILEQPKFAFNKATLSKESDSLLTEVAKVITDHPEVKYVEVAGYTDNVGNAGYNKTLSQKRAAAVSTWLQKHGVDKSRLGNIGHGKDDPIDTNATDAGRANNRRVEFHILDQAPSTKEFVRTKNGEAVPAKPAPPKTP